MASIDKITIQPLDNNNYATWSLRIMDLLEAKGAIKVKPDGEVVYTDERKALVHTRLNVIDHFLPLLKDCMTGSAALDLLKQKFAEKSRARRIFLARALNTLKKLPSEDVTTYAARAKAMNEELATVNAAISEDQLINVILVGLPAEYNAFTTVVTSSVPDGGLTLDSILPKLQSEEQRIGKLPNEEIAHALAIHRRPYNKSFKNGDHPFCNYCSSVGHHERNCRVKKREHQEQPQKALAGAVYAL